MKLFLAQTDPQTDAQLEAAIAEVMDVRRTRATIHRRSRPEATRADIQTAEAVFGVWSPEDAHAVGELAYAAGIGRPVYVVAPVAAPPWFCSGVGHGGHYPSVLVAVSAFLRDLMARRAAA
jgi:hypothetical protein